MMLPLRSFTAVPLRAAFRRFASAPAKKLVLSSVRRFASAPAKQLVLSSVEGSVGVLTLNNNERRNALSDVLVEQ